jgi:D-glycero-D-manno-heptose 1,7-bisphosphate phosphatase
MATKPAIFLDRDGTVNEEMGYINHAERFVLFPFVADSIRIFNDLGFLVIIVTNQSGIARGYFSEQLMRQIHNQLRSDLKKMGARVDAIYYCPHHPTEGKGKYTRECNCRKPKPGMIEQAVLEYDIDLTRSFMIGDRYKDIEFARNLNMRAALVLTGYGRGEYQYQSQSWQYDPDIVGDNLLQVARQIKSDILGQDGEPKR